MFSHIKQKMLVFLKPGEAINHIKIDLNIDTHIALNLMLLALRKKIADLPDDITDNAFIQALEEMAELIQSSRHEAAVLLENHCCHKKFDLYLQALQLHLQNYEYYLSIGIDFFSDSTKTGIPSHLFYNMGLPCCGTPPADFLNMISYDIVMEPEYARPEIINHISEFYIVYVTASSPNPYGHILLGTDQGYFHVNAAQDRPQYIPKEKFNDYLRDTVHMVLGVQQIFVPDMKAAREKLLELNEKSWLWRLGHNCANFSHVVLTAGGVSHAHVDPVHIGNYHKTQYPVELLGYINPVSLNKKVYSALSTEEKANLKNHLEGDVPLKKHFIGLGKCAGLKGKEAKAYARYRMDDGMSHRKAQYKAKPCFMNFLVLHHNKIRNVAALHPLLFILATPFLALSCIKSLSFHVNSFFYGNKQKNMGRKVEVNDAMASRQGSFSDELVFGGEKGMMPSLVRGCC